MSYTKLFASIVTSTIWTEDDKTRLLWITMLALADKNGEVPGSVPGLARIAGISLQDCEKSLARLMGPDKYSRSPSREGRRVEKIEGGWWLINHDEYRRRASKESEQEKTAARQKRFREKEKSNGAVTHSNGFSSHSNGTVTHDRDIAEAEAEAEAEADADADADADAEIPPNPQGGTGGKKGESKFPQSEEAGRICRIIGRGESTGWSSKEIRTFKSLVPIDPADLAAVEEYYAAEKTAPKSCCRKDVSTLLNNWRGEVDRAHAWKGKPTVSSAPMASASDYDRAYAESP